jgi:hypothetical protein
MKKSLFLLALILSSPAKADPLVQQFKRLRLVSARAINRRARAFS